jgi:CHC2-type zinc finger protein/DnaB helicase-like protein/Toprim domain-containing protein
MPKYTKEQWNDFKTTINGAQILASAMKLEKDGYEYAGLCPFHNEDTPSFKVWRNESGVWLAQCFGACAKTWNCFQVLAHINKTSVSEAVDKAKFIVGWEEGKVLAESVFSAVGASREFDVLPLEVLSQPMAALEKSSEGIKYLTGRGITMETARALKLGFIQSIEAVSPNHQWVDKGWIFIPTIENGMVTCVTYRSIFAKEGRDEKTGKKIIGTRRILNMESSLYNIESVSRMDDVFVTEGQPDVWTMTQAGYNAVGIPGASYSPTAEELDILVGANRIFLAGDNDATGDNCMRRLYARLQEKAFILKWPEGIKDANDALTKHCGSDTEKFQELVEDMKQRALSEPVPNYYDLAEVLMTGDDDTKPMDNPRRLHFRDPAVDNMAVVLPGSVVSLYAKHTGSGKTTWVLDQIELDEVLLHGSVVLNYSAELSPEEFRTLAAANILNKDRLTLDSDDRKMAGRILQLANAKFYIGYNPDLDRIGKVLDSIEWAIRRLGANIVVLDHLHFLTRGERDDIKAQADAMQRIKNMAVKLQVIFVVVGQSRKETQNGRGRAAEGSDAKGSETFTSDANAVYHITRAIKRMDAANPACAIDDNLETITDIRCMKSRTKGPGKASCRQVFVGNVGKFFPYTPQEQQS